MDLCVFEKNFSLHFLLELVSVPRWGYIKTFTILKFAIKIKKGDFYMSLIITSENFDTEVMQAEIPVLIDFWAPWCGPCRMVSPIVDELATEFEGNIKVVKVNVDEEPDIAAQFNVMSIPTLTVIREGKVAATSVGARPKDDIKQMLGI